MSLCLTKAELADLTDYKRRDKQIEALVAMEIPFRVDVLGSVRVRREDLWRGVRLTRLYLIRSEGRPRYLKIGISDDPERRVRDLQTGSPALLTLLAHITGCKERERYLHRRFRHLRAHGEWFKDRAEIRRVFGL